MATTFRALVARKTAPDAKGHAVSLETVDDSILADGDVTVRVTHSTVNYKDGLAITGRSPILRTFPVIPGIDFAGVVEESASPDFPVGAKVVLNGWGVGETHPGGYAERARVKAQWLVKLPDGLTTAQAMAIGTAGYTAMLCRMALDRFGMTPDRGPALVTGAAGGVGSVAVALMAAAGWEVIASTGRMEEAEYLKSLGASSVIHRDELSGPGKPLGKERWAAVIDSVGSHTLVNAIASTRYRGAVAACGLAQGMDLPGTVAPFILRGVSLLGVDSVMCPTPDRVEAWSRLAKELDHGKLAAMTSHIALEDVPRAAQDILAGKVRGRLVVDIG
ncbi:MDR family oxidoreductase [Camelimonas abortus]|uniref:MDR family oxidoreductase n=1 Tax=Camelimonas abortus TaxID=1017184 RepID=A0ABV7LI06_9HYPH